MQIEDFKNAFDEVLAGIKPNILVRSFIEKNEELFPKDTRVTLLGSGKAVLSMADAMYDFMDKQIVKSVLVGPYENSIEKTNLEYVKSTHPLPSSKSIDGANSLIKELKNLKEDDFFIYLLSGGNSALVELPIKDISLEDFQKTTDLMLKGGMPIEAINCVRKHISQVKGGRLATFTKANGIVLVLSDVLADDLQSIGSAPLYFDDSTFKDAILFLKKYKLFDLIPKSVKEYLLLGNEKKVEDTPKSEASNIKHYMVGSNSILVENMKNNLEKKGLNPIVLDKKIDDKVENVLDDILSFTKEEGCFIFGGEATVIVRGNGKGGRNQHLVLSFLDKFPKDKSLIFLSGASDGVDGNSDAAGAIIDENSLDKAKSLNIDYKEYLENFDSNSFFKELNLLLKPGPTHNNMLDIAVLYIKK